MGGDMNIEELIISTLHRALIFGTPLLLATVGEIYAERSGILNLGVEGMMLIGALSGFVTTMVTSDVWLGFGVAILAGGLAACVHGFLTVTLRVNQVVSGLALTMFGLGITGVLGRGWEGRPLFVSIPKITVPYLSDIPYIGEIIFTKQDVFVYISIGIAVALWFVLFHTSIGITIRSVGENPAAADTSGVRVSFVQYACVCLGGMLAGAGGAYLSVVYRPAWTEGVTAGMGWLAIALVIFAFWNPLYGMLGAYFFGGLFHLSFRLQMYIAPELLRAMPYVLTIVVLIVISQAALKRRVGMPASLGLPYKRGTS